MFSLIRVFACLTTVVSLSACVIPIPSGGARGDVDAVTLGSTVASSVGRDALRHANAARADEGLQTLGTNPRLQAAAKAHANWMARTGTHSHTGAGGTNVGGRLRAAGYCYLEAEENVAFGYRNGERVIDGWLGSSEHRGTVLTRRATEGAVAATRGGGTIYWAMVVARPC